MSCAGFSRLLIRHPWFAIRLLFARIRFFFTRTMDATLATPDGFHIEAPSELISYWSFFVEREGCASEWLQAVKREANPLVLDVGANAGVFTHLIWSLRRDAEIIAFDPLPKMAAKLEAWRERTGARLTVHNQAVSDHCGSMSFFATADNDTGASLRPRDVGTPSVTVPVVTLDSIVPNRTVLLAKFDVEGAEAEALAGARDMLRRTRFLILEAHTGEALEGIRRELGENWLCRRVGGSDYFFWRRPTTGS
jgi:FkbM family methyltransferase